jgi:ribosome-binding protein aMBF1 (putative translation factor)
VEWAVFYRTKQESFLILDNTTSIYNDKTMSLSDELRAAIKAHAASRYRIAHDLDISEATLCRFMSGERGLTLKVVDELCEYLSLKLVKRGRGEEGISVRTRRQKDR